MKKPNQNAEAHRITSAELAAAKRPVRQSKKTVLMIASMDSGNEHLDADFSPSDSLQSLPNNAPPESKTNRVSSTAKSISPELATAFSCKLMAIALQLRSGPLFREEDKSILDEIEELVSSFDDVLI